MKILYLADIHAYRDSGVLQKITQTAAAWREFGHEVQICVISSPPRPNEKLSLIEGKIVTSPFFYVIPCQLRYQTKYLNKVLSIGRIGKILREFAPDIVYFRQTVWFPGMISAIKKGNCPFIVEVNTKEISEYKLRGGLEGFIHLRTRHWLLKKANGLVAVSHEIAETLNEFKQPLMVASNGFDVGSVLPRPSPRNSRIQMIFVGSPGFVWHGVDRIEELAKHLPNMDFHLVGSRLESTLPNVINHGYLQHHDLARLYQSMDVGIGTLALSRNNMLEASTLKVREYLAYGLPAVVAYKDTDLHDCKFVLNINEDMDISTKIKRIEEFCYFWQDKPIDRKVIAEKIDFRSKEKKRLDFLNSIKK